MIKTLTKSIDYKEEKSGKISGYFATFDHDKADSYGDVIRKGSFLNTIAERKKTGHPFPFCFNHNFDTIIGKVTDIGENSKGAYFTAEFFDTEKAQEIRNIVKSGVLWQFSFGYTVKEQGKVKLADGSTANELREIDLLEISIVLAPANPRATITDIKAELLDSIAKIEKELGTTKNGKTRTTKNGRVHIKTGSRPKTEPKATII